MNISSAITNQHLQDVVINYAGTKYMPYRGGYIPFKMDSIFVVCGGMASHTL